MKRSKRYKASAERIEQDKAYSIEDGVKILKEFKTTKFDESVDIAIRLGVDPKKADQMVPCSSPISVGRGWNMAGKPLPFAIAL